MIRLGIVATEEYIGPHGLRCMDCHKLITLGMECAERLDGMIGAIPMVEIICGECGRSHDEAGEDTPSPTPIGE